MNLRRLLPYVSLLLLLLLSLGCSGGSRKRATDPAATGRYGHALHDRFYESWQAPDLVGAPPGKRLSVPVEVVIDPRGRVAAFNLLKRSGYPAFDASVAAVGKRVRKVKAPPIEEGVFRLRINFDLDIER